MLPVIHLFTLIFNVITSVVCLPGVLSGILNVSFPSSILLLLP